MSMKSLSSLEIAFEDMTGVECLLFFRYKGDAGDFKEIPVITERHWKVDSETGDRAEFFRARALAPNNIGKDFHSKANSVSVTVCHKRKRVRFGPQGSIIMLQKGVGLGSALMSHVIERLQSTGCGGYAVESGFLSGARDGADPENRLRRNKFYARLGFELSSTSGETGLEVVEGKFSAESVGVLTPCLRPDSTLCDWSTSQTYAFQKQMAGATAKRRLAEVQDWYRNRLGGWGRMVANRLRIPIR
jgi:GNAT superfamily N-acetyltransferase